MNLHSVGIMGHRPTKIFIITTGGRLDTLFARIVLWVSVHTWGRWTRWYPQNIVTLAAVVYFAFGIANLWMAGGTWRGWNGVGNALTALVICGVCVYLEFMSWRLRGLSGKMTEITLAEVMQARSSAGVRPVAGLIVSLGIVGLGLHPDASQIIGWVGLFAWMWALYTVTMGRSGVPPKKARRKMRLPSLPKLPRLLPVPTR